MPDGEAVTVLEGHSRTLTHVPPLFEEELMKLADVTREITRGDFLQLYYYRRLTRTLEDRISALYRQGRIVENPPRFHLGCLPGLSIQRSIARVWLPNPMGNGRA